MKGANYIKECGKTIAVVPSNAKAFTLEEMQKFVGGYIQMIHLKNGDIMVINEEGKLNAFRVNDKATEFFQKDFGEIDVIVGNVLITSSKFVN
jgi:hypothetical protein